MNSPIGSPDSVCVRAEHRRTVGLDRPLLLTDLRNQLWSLREGPGPTSVGKQKPQRKPTSSSPSLCKNVVIPSSSLLHPASRFSRVSSAGASSATPPCHSCTLCRQRTCHHHISSPFSSSEANPKAPHAPGATVGDFLSKPVSWEHCPHSPGCL